MGFLKNSYNYLAERISIPMVSAALLFFVALLAVSNTASALSPHRPGGMHQFPTIVDPNGEGVQFMKGPEPNTLVFCEGTPGEDGIHVCQVWLLVSPEYGIPASPEAYCFVAGEEEVIHDGVAQAVSRWSCGLVRDELLEERKAQGPVSLLKHPSRPGEYSI